MGRTAKGRNLIFSQNSLKIQSGNLHFIPTHYIKFQEPSLNTVQDILLTRFNSDWKPKGHISKQTCWTKKKIRVSYFSLGTQIWNFETLACRVLKIWHAQKSLMNGQKDRCTNKGKIICLINFIRNWGHIQVIYSSLQSIHQVSRLQLQ